MKKVIIDTNVLISFVTDRDPDKQERTVPLFSKAAALKHELICHLNVITEFVHVMDRIYRIGKPEINGIISDLHSMPGIRLVCDIRFKTLLEVWPSTTPDYGDAILAALCMDTPGTSIATFDEKFKKNLHKRSIPVFNF